MRWTPVVCALALLLGACSGRTRPPDVAKGPGVLEVHVTDAVTGAPIPRCDIVGYDEGGRLTEVMPSPNDRAAPDGVHRFEHEAMRGRVRLAATGYGETWTRVVSVRPGATTRVAVAMRPHADARSR